MEHRQRGEINRMIWRGRLRDGRRHPSEKKEGAERKGGEAWGIKGKSVGAAHRENDKRREGMEETVYLSSGYFGNMGSML